MPTSANSQRWIVEQMLEKPLAGGRRSHLACPRDPGCGLVIDFCHASRSNRGARGYGRVCRYARSFPARKRHNRASRIAVLPRSGGAHHPKSNELWRHQFRYCTRRRTAGDANGYSNSTLVLVYPFGSVTGWPRFSLDGHRNSNHLFSDNPTPTQKCMLGGVAIY